MGVDLRLDTRVADLDSLFDEGYEAVLIAAGAHKGRRLPIPGGELEGVLEATALLRDTRLGHPPDVGKRVLVLGGGDVAFDAARTALRLGASFVDVAFLESQEDMLASPAEVQAATDEGVKLHPSRSFGQILDRDGRVWGVECVRVESFSFRPDGKLELETKPASEHILGCDTVVFATGQGVDLGSLATGGGVEVTSAGAAVADPETMQTQRPGVFAAGDAVTGTSFVVEAIAAGHRSADAIERYLSGRDSTPPYTPPPNTVT
ncbi:MAG: FAD-dependent oxidoreductase, partial [Myxococcota bacterium]|nr:FAD-dependent oxidoreductase [Myxococcota bacterium]